MHLRGLGGRTLLFCQTQSGWQTARLSARLADCNILPDPRHPSAHIFLRGLWLPPLACCSLQHSDRLPQLQLQWQVSAGRQRILACSTLLQCKLPP